MKKRRGLGRGLEALIPLSESDGEPGELTHRPVTRRVPLGQIRPNPEQPRRVFAPEELAELADSIRIHGVLQPLLAREVADGYELIAGERRLRAAEIAGLKEVPVILHTGIGGGFEQRLELSLVENLQRSDLNAVEEARAMRRLLEEFGLTQEAVAERLGKSRVAVANTVRLLSLPGSILNAVETGAISAAHARALLGLASAAQQLAAVERIVREKWSSHQTEDWVRTRINSGPPRERRSRRQVDPNTQALEEEFRRALGTRVLLTRLKQGGRLIIEFYSDEELEGLRQRLVSN
jgi:ParB family chromosome partitioning protein